MERLFSIRCPFLNHFGYSMLFEALAVYLPCPFGQFIPIGNTVLAMEYLPWIANEFIYTILRFAALRAAFPQGMHIFCIIFPEATK